MAVLVAVVTAMALSAGAAFAESDYSITVENDNSHISIAGKTYTAYKLFDATYSGSGADAKASYTIKKTDYFYTNEDAKAILDKYFDFTAAPGDNTIMVVTVKSSKQDATTKTLSAGDTRALADELQAVLEGATAAGSATVSTGEESATIEVATAGYYVVDGKAKATGDDSVGEIVAAVALTNAKPTATVKPKADAPSVDKTITKIANGTDKVESDGKTGNGSVGDKVEYQYASAVPDMTGYSAYTFKFTDTMSKGLTFNDDVTVTIDGTSYTAFTKSATTNATTGVTTLTVTFNNFIDQASKAGKAIVVKYSATINEKAVVTGVEENKVKLDYSINPYDENLGTPNEVTGKTPESTTKVYTTNIELTKKDSDNKLLTGAKFSISGNSSNVNIINSEVYKQDAEGTWYRLKDGTYTETAATSATEDQYESTTVKYKKTTTIDKTSAAVTGYTNEGWVKSDSTLTFNGLGEGTYTITELIAPEGYNLLSSPITVVVTFNPETKAFEATVDGDDATVENNTIKFDVVNNKGTELPSTGGMGTTILYTVGAILVIGAVVLLITRRRMNNEK